MLPTEPAKYLPGLEPEVDLGIYGDNLPPDIAEAMRIITGAEPVFDNGQELPSASNFPQSAQKKFLEERSKNKFDHKISNLSVRSFNLRSKIECKEYEEFIAKHMELSLSNPTTQKFIEHPLQFVSDPKTGDIRILAVVRAWKQEALPAKKESQYDIVSGDTRPTRIV
jgi:hypothetical protein